MIVRDGVRERGAGVEIECDDTACVAETVVALTVCRCEKVRELMLRGVRVRAVNDLPEREILLLVRCGA